MQVVFPVHGRREPILGVVGPLQLDIVEARLKQEYSVECKIDQISYVALFALAECSLSVERKDISAMLCGKDEKKVLRCSVLRFPPRLCRR